MMIFWTRIQLRSKDPAVRVKAVLALRDSRSSDARDLLIRAIQDSSPRVRAEAVEALGVQLGGSIAYGDWEHVARLGDQVTESLLTLLKDPPAFPGRPAELVRVGAIKALGAIGDRRALEPLLACLNIRERRAEESLLDWVVGFDHSEAANEAIEALAGFADGRVLGAFNAVLFDDFYGRSAYVAVVETLARLRDASSVRPLLHRLSFSCSTYETTLPSAIVSALAAIGLPAKNDIEEELHALGEQPATNTIANLRSALREALRRTDPP